MLLNVTMCKKITQPYFSVNCNLTLNKKALGPTNTIEIGSRLTRLAFWIVILRFWHIYFECKIWDLFMTTTVEGLLSIERNICVFAFLRTSKKGCLIMASNEDKHCLFKNLDQNGMWIGTWQIRAKSDKDPLLRDLGKTVIIN